MVHATGRVRLDSERRGRGRVCKLGATENMEVVVGGVTAGVALGADGGAEDD